MREVLERVVRELSTFERPSASAGEREAADWIAGELRAAGCRDVRVEECFTLCEGEAHHGPGRVLANPLE